VYVANQAYGTVTVIDGGTNNVVATISLSSTSFDVAVNETTGRIYATEYVSNTVAVIDPQTNAVIAHLPVGAAPFGVDVRHSDSRVYVTNSGSDTISLIDGVTDTVAGTLPVGLQPRAVAADQVAGRAYVANYGGDTLSLIGVDTIAPTWPIGSVLTVSAVTMTDATLQWSAALDDNQLAQYLLYKDGQLVATLSAAARSHTVTGLTGGSAYTFTVQARDRAGNTSVDGPSIVVTTLTPAQAIDALIGAVNALAPTPLSLGRANGLIAALNAALNQIAAGNVAAAANQLEAFVQQVEALVASGELMPGQANALISQATAIVTALGG